MANEKISNVSKKILKTRINEINQEIEDIHSKLSSTKAEFEALKVKRDQYLAEIERLKEEKQKIQDDLNG